MAHTVLLIEDNPDVGFLYKEGLESEGFTVDLATDGDQGLELMRKNAYDIVLLDLMLPGRHGLSVLRELKGEDDTKGVPVYVLSALGDTIVSDQAANTGADGFFVKSQSGPLDVAEKLKGILGGS